MGLSKEMVAAGLHTAQVAAVGGSWATGIVAGTTQTQAGATALTAAHNVIGTCANINDGVRLPEAAAGDAVYVRNDGAQVAKVYPPVGGSINGGATNAAVTLAAGASVVFRYRTSLDSYS